MSEATAGNSAQAEGERRWYAGRNGGRLRPGDGSPGPRKATVLVRKALVEALRDPRGGAGAEFFVRLKTGSAEDKRTFANITARLIPIEVAADLGGELLRVVVNTLTLAAVPNGEHVPMQGTSLIGENARSSPMPTPITVKIPEVIE